MPDTDADLSTRLRMSIGLDSIPGTSQLYKDYVCESGAAHSLFVRQPFMEESLKSVFSEIEARDYERGALASILFEQNEALGAPRAALEMCRKLEDPACVAVVTGQQVGFLGGPMYAALKAMHAIRLARWVEERQNRPAVPIFWMECEDHDLAEVDHVVIRNGEGEKQVIHLAVQQPSDTIPVNRLRLGSAAENGIRELEKAWPKTAFSDSLMERIARWYEGKETTLADGFGRMFADLLGCHGLIMANPGHPVFKRRVSDLFEKEISQPLAATEGFARQSERIAAAQYHSQVRTEAARLNLFLLDSDEKLRIIKENNFYALDNPSEVISADDLMMVAESEPERLVPAVLLRPIVQDRLFPTAMYVAGPGEIAYFAQLPPVYEHFDVPMPIIVPRSSMSIVDGAGRRTIRRYDIEMREVFQPARELLNHIISEHVPDKARQRFDWTEKEIFSALDRLRDELDSGEGNIGTLVEVTREKVTYHLEKLKERFLRELENRHEIVVRRIEHLSTMLYPDERPQERVYSIAEFLNLSGPTIIEAMLEAIDPAKPSHELLEL